MCGPVFFRLPQYCLIVICCLAIFSSCRSRHRTSEKKSEKSFFESGRFDEDDFASILTDNLHLVDSNKLGVSNAFYEAYHSNEFFPLWLNDDGTATSADELLNDLDSIRWDGLEPERYRVSYLRQQLSSFKSQTTGTIPLADVLTLDTALTANYLKACHDLLIGTITPKDVDSLWFHSNDSTWRVDSAIAALKDNRYLKLDFFKSTLPTYNIARKAYRHYLMLEKDSAYSSMHTVENKQLNDSELVTLIRKEVPWLGKPDYDTFKNETQGWIFAYQQYYGLRRIARVDSATRSYLFRSPSTNINVLRANLERLRWLPQQTDSLYVLVNIPTMELYIRKDGYDAMHMNVVVGKPVRQTPALEARMTNVVINPPWGVPPTILKKDVLPGISKSGMAYLRSKGLKVYDHKGNAVDASTVNASNYKRYVFRQPPGEDNALGYVKFNLPNKWDIYLHDTPHREDFEKWDRARSSGCIRLSRPKELAEYILSDLEHRRYDIPRIDSVIQTQKTRWEILKNKIPVHIVYLTAIEDATGTGIRFGRDIYKRDEKLMAALGQ